MRAVDFFDSNILVYLFDTRDPRRNAIASELIARARRDGNGVISFQVVQETLNVLVRRLDPPLSLTEKRKLLNNVLVPLWRIHPSPALYARGLEIQERYGYAFYDSLILAAALQAGCTRVLSEDMQHGQQIETLVIENPFEQVA